ncbi:MAG: helix-turn-helix transcriptional regulator [Proteobacteria bacterium]|nr:helix-turn-helix transcriptional regulator [Pseudomonadota bacterium]
MKSTDVVVALGALAHEHRLAVYRLLVERGPDGLSAGDIASQVGLVPSSLTFHTQALARAGLITQRRAGRQLRYAADFSVMTGLIEYLTRNCCGGEQNCAPGCAPAGPQRTATNSRRSA